MAEKNCTQRRVGACFVFQGRIRATLYIVVETIQIQDNVRTDEHTHSRKHTLYMCGSCSLLCCLHMYTPFQLIFLNF